VFNDYITPIIAVWGAILSTALAIREILKDRRYVKVDCRMSIAVSNLGKPLEFVSIDVVNTGQRPIQIKKAGLLLNTDELFFQIKSMAGYIPLPKKLEDSESLSINFDLDQVGKAIENTNGKKWYTKAIIEDSEGKKYTTRLPRLFKDRKWTK
jgi:hypothetical protein